MRKYNDLIVSLIKAHRKFPGCESILDRIVDDVYKNAEVVLNTVTNESVVTSYLSKIVSTSMITVPKKLGVNQKDESGSIVAQILAEPLSVPVAVANEDTLPLAEEETDDEPEMELTEADVEEVADNEIEELSLETEGNQDEEQDAVLDDESLANELSYTEESAEKFMEPGIAEKEEIVEQVYEENIIYKDLPSEPEVDKELVDKMINGISEESLDSVEVVHDEVIAEDENELLQENNDDSLELDFEGVEKLPELGESATGDLYKKFEFIPQDTESYDSEILSKIKTLSAKQPDKNIYEICKLKYGKNMSVSEVSSKLNIEEDAVIEALNDVIYEIKD